MTTVTLNAFDVRTPDQAQDVMAAVVATYTLLAKNIQITLDKQKTDGVDGAPLAFLTSMGEAAYAILRTAEVSADEFAREAQRLDDALLHGAGGSLLHTQSGSYGDRTRR